MNLTFKGNTCPAGWYVLEPELALQDTFLFIEDGTLVLPYESPEPYHTEDFCFEHVSEPLRVIQNESSLRVLVCFVELDREHEPVPALLPVSFSRALGHLRQRKPGS